MITLRPSRERGHFDFGWLDTYHTFSFGEYQDPAHQGFRTLRVINEDRIHAGQGFGAHGHRDMEILTWILAGTLAHEDSAGNRGTLVPGDAQRMSAGRGIRHSEFNGSATEEVHLLQIWVLPGQAGLTPAYEQKHFPMEGRRNRFALIASGTGRDGSLAWNQDVELHAASLEAGVGLALPLAEGRAAWVQVARGAVEVNGVRLEAGDGAAVEREPGVVVKGLEAAEVLLFDLA